MKIEIVCLLILFGAMALVGLDDYRAAEISRKTAMDAPRPIFEPAHEVLPLSIPCTYIQQKRFDHEPTSSRNTRCAKADRSE